MSYFQSDEIFTTLKGQLNKDYKMVCIEIEDVVNTLENIGKEDNWFTLIDDLSETFSQHSEMNENQKKQVIKSFVDKIILQYDDKKKLHHLDVNFRIPMIFLEGGSTNKRLKNPPRYHKNGGNQLTHLSDYSTVTDFAKFLG